MRAYVIKVSAMKLIKHYLVIVGGALAFIAAAETPGRAILQKCCNIHVYQRMFYIVSVRILHVPKVGTHHLTFIHNDILFFHAVSFHTESWQNR